MATLIKSTGHTEEVKPANGKKFTLEELQGFVGGYIEVLKYGQFSVMVVNEEGKILGLPVNLSASSRYAEEQRNSQLLVGDVLICHIREMN